MAFILFQISIWSLVKCEKCIAFPLNSISQILSYSKETILGVKFKWIDLFFISYYKTRCFFFLMSQCSYLSSLFSWEFPLLFSTIPLFKSSSFSVETGRWGAVFLKLPFQQSCGFDDTMIGISAGLRKEGKKPYTLETLIDSNGLWGLLWLPGILLRIPASLM